MKRLLLIVTLVFLSSVLWTDRTEAKPTNVQAWQEGTGTQAVVKLKWKYESGDRPYRTFNGDQWVEVTFTAPNAGEAAVVSDNNDGAGFNKGSNVYYEIRDAGYSAVAVNGKARGVDVQEHLKRVNVFIDSGNPTAEYAHGNYLSNTNTCAACHSNHKGKGSAKQLLIQDSIRALCETCHTEGQNGSKYLVDYGAVRDNQGKYLPSPAGPITMGTEAEIFGSAAPDIDELKARGIKKATSAHAYTGDHVAPGDRLNLDKNGILLPMRNMQCTSCHQAHSSDNNYRLLKSVNNSYSTDPVTGKIITTVVPVVVEAYAVNDGAGETVRYKSGITQFCEQCHKVFRDGTKVTYNEETIYLHPGEKAMNLHGALLTSDLPLQNVKDLAPGDSPNNITLTNGKTRESYITCITCHYGHGTTAIGEQPSNYTTGVTSTMLKRMDNQGICQECHKQ